MLNSVLLASAKVEPIGVKDIMHPEAANERANNHFFNFWIFSTIWTHPKFCTMYTAPLIELAGMRPYTLPDKSSRTTPIVRHHLNCIQSGALSTPSFLSRSFDYASKSWTKQVSGGILKSLFVRDYPSPSICIFPQFMYFWKSKKSHYFPELNWNSITAIPRIVIPLFWIMTTFCLVLPFPYKLIDATIR